LKYKEKGDISHMHAVNYLVLLVVYTCIKCVFRIRLKSIEVRCFHCSSWIKGQFPCTITGLSLNISEPHAQIPPNLYHWSAMELPQTLTV